ncbi:MAG: delta-60 repeat domain-containing protein [Dokdonella sp.]
MAKTFTHVAFAGVFAAITSVAMAADGDLDTSFGIGGLGATGVVTGSGTDNGCRPVVQVDGKVVICGTRSVNGSSGSDFFVARFNANGTLDTSFSFDGLVTIDFDNGAGSDTAAGVALQADGKIVVAGTTQDSQGNADFAVAMLSPDGSLDPAFGAGTGKTTVAFDLNGGVGSDVCNAVVVQSDGKIVIAGGAQTETANVFALARLLPDGTRDSAFNLNGKVTLGFGISGLASEAAYATTVAIDDSGRIVVSGTDGYNDGVHTINEFAVARILANGIPDANFHANGRTTIAFDPGNGISAALNLGMTIQRDGRIVLVGASNSSASATSNYDIAVARLQPDGSLDAGFGFAGRTQIPFDLVPAAFDAGFAVAQESNGRLLIAGTSLLSTTIEVGTIVRLTANGTLDAAFGALGKRTYNFSTASPPEQAFTGVAFQGTQIIMAGFVGVNGGFDNVIVRLANDLIFADGF